jgi:hypothetical protein
MSVPTAVGVKGSDMFENTGDPRVTLSMQLVRGLTPETICSGMNAIWSVGTVKAVEDAVVMAFQTRDIRGGKGEKKLFNKMWQCIYEKHPQLAEALVPLIPEYGSWNDVVHFAAKEPSQPFLDLLVQQIRADEEAFAAGTKLSLVGKWAPREGKQFDKVAKQLALRLSAHVPSLQMSQRLATYRKRMAKLNAALKTVETFECSDHWDEIDPKLVPGRAREIKKAAYLNETLKGRGQLRHPHNEKRMTCREHFQAFFKAAAAGEVKINGSQTLYPHEIVKKAVGLLGRESEEDRNSLNAVWDAMVADARAKGGLGRSIVMCDFSGSMQSSATGDTPYWVSMAMGILISSVTTDEFKDMLMTFDSSPQWFKFRPEEKTLFQKLQALRDAGHIGQGTSTDFQKALDLVLATLKMQRVRPGSEPKDLIVITDMGWDQACASNERGFWTGNSYRHVVKTEQKQTHIQMAREAFKRAGEDLWSTAWKVPRIVIWNVAATGPQSHAQSTEEGVIILAGWSPSLFKVLCADGAQVQNPYDGLRAQLDDPRYDAVRAVVRTWAEGGWRVL